MALYTITDNGIVNFGFVIDFQNDFVKGVLGTPEARAISNKLAEWIKNFDGTLFLTRDTHYSNYRDTLEGSNLPVPHCIAGTEGWNVTEEIMEALENSKNGVTPYTFVDKPGFAYTEWENVLHLLELKCDINCDEVKEVNFHFAGVCTDICVSSNTLFIMGLIQAMEIPTSKCKFNFYVHKDLCAGTTVENHEAALNTMSMCHIKVV